MRFPLISTALAAICFALPTTAQGLKMFGGASERHLSFTLLVGNNGGMAAVSVAHGQPEWKDEYDSKFDELMKSVKGKTNRLGKNWWTTFQNSVPVEIGGMKVPAGSYFVGLQCDKDGKFALAMLDSTKAMKAGAMPFGAQDWTPDAVTPLTFNQNASKQSVKKMVMNVSTNKADRTQGTFTLAWGRHTLTAPMKIHFGK